MKAAILLLTVFLCSPLRATDEVTAPTPFSQANSLVLSAAPSSRSVTEAANYYVNTNDELVGVSDVFEGATIQALQEGEDAYGIVGTATGDGSVGILALSNNYTGVALRAEVTGGGTPFQIVNDEGATFSFYCVGHSNCDIVFNSGNSTVAYTSNFNSPPAIGAGTPAPVTATNLCATSSLVLSKTITASGTTGNQTINKISGTVNVAAAGTTVTVTNSLVNASSLVFTQLRTNDSTAWVKNCVCGSGTFTINLGAAATGEVSIGWFVTN